MQLTDKIRLTLRNGRRYLPLLKNLISRELKRKYRQSLLGYVWCVLNPLLILIILTVVFSRMFHNKIENFPVYLCAGRIMFNFVTDSTSSMLSSIVGNAQLMRKTRVPYYIFPLANMGSSVVNFLFQIVALVIVLVWTGCYPGIHVIAFPLVCLEMFVFCFGLGMLLAIANIHVRDTRYIYNVFTTAWLYLSALFYPITNLPEILQTIVRRFNPAYYFMSMSRDIFYLHRWPETDMLLRGALVAVLFCTAGLWTYSRARKNMILYV